MHPGGRVVVTTVVSVAITSASCFTPSAALPPALDCSEWNRLISENPVVGVPEFNGERGGIEVGAGSDRVVLTRSDLGLGEGAAGDRFGSAFTMPFDGSENGCLSLVVGAPGVESTGVVYILEGSGNGLLASVERMPDAHAGDQFGASVSVGLSEGDAYYYVVAGAPGRDVDGATDAGAIGYFNFFNPADGVTMITQSSPGIAGAPEQDDRFGEVLSPPFDHGEDGLDVLVGVPHEDVGSTRDAGVVEQVALFTQSSNPKSRLYRQGLGGSTGIPEAGDRFGSALALANTTLAVGVPGEDVGRLKNAGVVHLLYTSSPSSPEAPFEPQGVVTQESRHVPGRSERGDRFGGSLIEFDYCPPEGGRTGKGAKFAIGAPGEDLGRAENAGVVVLYDSGLRRDPDSDHTTPTIPTCASKVIRQDGVAPGHAEDGDELGTDVGRVGEEPRPAELLISVPGEDLAETVDAGLIEVIGVGSPMSARAQGFADGPLRRLHYGRLPTA